MQRRVLSSERLEFRSIEDEHIEDIHRYMQGDFGTEVGGFLDFDPPWAPVSKDQIKAKLDEMMKKERTRAFTIWSKKEEFIGLAVWGAEWDTWSPYFSVLIWPEHRRKGHGTEAANLLMEASFDHHLAHVVCCAMPDFDERAIAFTESLGFKNQGARRRVGKFNGKYFDYIHMDILKDEYLATRSKRGDE